MNHPNQQLCSWRGVPLLWCFRKVQIAHQLNLRPPRPHNWIEWIWWRSNLLSARLSTCWMEPQWIHLLAQICMRYQGTVKENIELRTCMAAQQHRCLSAWGVEGNTSHEQNFFCNWVTAFPWCSEQR